jgi:murein DD-endopeptidase MepM/ murein hydrolase activator NlpD
LLQWDGKALRALYQLPGRAVAIADVRGSGHAGVLIHESSNSYTLYEPPSASVSPTRGRQQGGSPITSEAPSKKGADPAQDVKLDRTGPDGFFYPTGSREDAHNDAYGNWKERDKKHGGNYEKGYYHLGKDIPAAGPLTRDPGSSVYAIADGEVVYVRTTDANDSSYFGTGNSALFVRHALKDGREFLALYLHVRPLPYITDHLDSAGKPNTTAAVR